MLKTKKRAIIAGLCASAWLFAPLAAHASLFGQEILAEMFLTDPTVGSPVAAFTLTPIVTEAGVEITTTIGTEQHVVDFGPPDGHDVSIQITDLTGQQADWAERWWRFSNLSWGTSTPGILTDVTIDPFSSAGSSVTSVDDDAFIVYLPATSQVEPNGTRGYGFDLVVEHVPQPGPGSPGPGQPGPGQPGPGIPVPGTMLLLGAGLAALSRVRRS